MKRLFTLFCGIAMLAGAGCSKSNDNSNPHNGGNGGKEDGGTPNITGTETNGARDCTEP